MVFSGVGELQLSINSYENYCNCVNSNILQAIKEPWLFHKDYNSVPSDLVKTPVNFQFNLMYGSKKFDIDKINNYAEINGGYLGFIIYT